MAVSNFLNQNPLLLYLFLNESKQHVRSLHVRSITALPSLLILYLYTIYTLFILSHSDEMEVKNRITFGKRVKEKGC